MKKQFIKKFFLIFILFILLLTGVNAQFYADIKINVDSSGFVNINGRTNYDNFFNITNSQNFVSKKDSIWTLDISSKKDEIFDDFIFELILPENSQISYMKTTPNFRIEDVGSKIRIIGIGENKPFTLLVQYKINKSTIFDSQSLLINILVSFLIIIILVIGYFGYKLLKKETRIENLEEEITDVIEDSNLIDPKHKLKFQKYNIDDFPQRQQEIIKLLQENNSLTQDEITEIMNIPKSSVSRNIRALEFKKIIRIIEKGRYNKIILNEKKILEIGGMR